MTLSQGENFGVHSTVVEHRFSHKTNFNFFPYKSDSLPISDGGCPESTGIGGGSVEGGRIVVGGPSMNSKSAENPL